MQDIIIESLIACSSLVVCWTLFRAVTKYQVTTQPGSLLILAGFSLLCLSFLIDITDNFPQLNQYVLIGDTDAQAFIEKVIGSLLGLIFLAIGFRRWLPSVLELAVAKNELLQLNNSLEQLVNERTTELRMANNQLVVEINEREQAQLKLNVERYQDLLTELPNRYALLKYITAGKSKNLHNNIHHAVFLIDINNFKSINDSLGHAKGDQVLKSIAKRLSFNHRSQDYLARIGGDEFMLVIQNLDQEPQRVALKTYNHAIGILDILSTPLKVDGQVINLTACIGISVFNHHSTNSAEDILRQADIALYNAKDKGKGYFSFFEPEMQEKAQKFLNQANELHQAIKNNEFELAYQPQVDNNEKLIGVEALLRWQHPTKGMIGPGEFIALAEEIGVIDKIGRYALDLACQECATLASADYPQRALKVAVNISPSHFLQEDFVGQIETILSRHDLQHIQLVIEITEEETVSDINDTCAKMNKLRSYGIQFSLDDFGTGYCSLTYLKKLPVDTVKIDRSFISDVDKNADDASIITAILTMANALNINVIAEGIDKEEQYRLLKAKSCQYYQGFFFGKPQAITKLLSKSRLQIRPVKQPVIDQFD